MSPANSSQRLQTPYGNFDLARYPARAGERLLAWCGADIVLLEEIFRRDVPGPNILVVNDAHGALCVALQPRALWTDSALAAQALRRNERANTRLETPLVWSTHAPMPASMPAVNYVAMRIPKQLSFFEYQLSVLARVLPAGAIVLAAGMDKHLSPHTAKILERFIGPTRRHRGQRKARLFSAMRDDRPVAPGEAPATYFCDSLGVRLLSLANVFSSQKLDMGSRFLLEQLHRLDPVENLIDLACGNGVLGLAAFKRKLTQHLVFCDESAMAIDSAQRNAIHCFAETAQDFTFHLGDGLNAYRGKPAQLILCNPPFHLGHTVEEYAGRRLLRQCASHLTPGGHLCLVANRHLSYLTDLGRSFARVEKFAENAKFSILLAQRS